MATPPKIPGLGAFIDKDPHAAKPSAPKPVAIAAWLLVLAAVVQVAASVIAVIHSVSPERMVVLQQQIDAMTGNVPSVESMRNMGVITVVVAGIATAGAYLLFAYFLTKGRLWARMAAAILVALTLVQLVGIAFPEGMLTVAQLVLGGIAVGLCYLPVSKQFFAAMKAARS